MTHLVGGHFIGNGSLARLAGISLTRKIFHLVMKLECFLELKGFSFQSFFKNYKKNSIGSNTAVALTDCKQSGHV